MYTSEGKKIISTEKAPRAIGPYSQAICIEGLVFTAGQLGLDPATMELVEGGVNRHDRKTLQASLGQSQHGRVAVEHDQPARGTEAFGQQAGVAAATDGGVHDGLARDRL